MNQINRSTRFSQKQDIHPLVAALDETNEDQRRLRDLIRRFHSGRTKKRCTAQDHPYSVHWNDNFMRGPS